jgi:hypothetical protein
LRRAAPVLAVVLGTCVPLPVAAGGPGSMVLDPLNETLISGTEVMLTGTITNMCSAPLKNGSSFVFAFDDVAFASFAITALTYGSTQPFKVSGTIAAPKAPKKNTTSLDFSIALPDALQFGGIPTQKTSPCFVTLAPVTPI